MSSTFPARLACAACGAEAAPQDPYPFRCPAARSGADVDHLMVRTLDLARVHFPRTGDPNPFVRFRELLRSYHVARAGGMSDADFVSLAEDLDRRVAAVDGRGFVVTPLAPHLALGRRIGLEAGGALWVKDETGNVSGSHKGRHLMGLAIHLEVVERLGYTSRAETDRRGLAVASCGNAALAAAVIANAVERPLEVFIPPDADSGVVARLQELAARITICQRRTGERGDPCYRAFQEAVEAGTIPFCCQGPANGLTVEGGQTLAWEMASVLAGATRSLDRLFVQVGGGALASACVRGLGEAVALGLLPRLPRLHAVQTTGGAPLRRAYERVRERALARLMETPSPATPSVARDAVRAQRLARPDAASAVSEVLAEAQHHRSLFMWPWEHPPRSVAHGILDDETYDWHAVVTGMLASGGFPVTVGEDRLEEAHHLVRSVADVQADHTGVAGLAGLLELRAQEAMGGTEAVAVLFTGVER